MERRHQWGSKYRLNGRRHCERVAAAYAMRARLALAASGTRYELREVRLADKPAALLSASPKGTVPVLQTADGTVIDESLAIMRWALEAQDCEGWLTRDDQALIAINDGKFKHHLDR